jgi:HSP20 family molecular chaperone IbpA
MVDTVSVPVEPKHSRLEPPESYFVPATDIYETADELVLVADLPGVKADGLDVTLEDNILVIRAKPREEPKAGGDVLLQEFAAGECYRAFQLPADFDTTKVQATLKQGVLTLRLPKSERLKPRRIEVKAE